MTRYEGMSYLHRRLRGASSCTGVLLVLAVLAVVMTYPLITGLDSHIIGGSTATLIDFWRQSAAGWGLRRRLPMSPTSLLGYRVGADLACTVVSWVDAGLLLTLDVWPGPVAAFSQVQLLHVVLCGVTMHALALPSSDHRLRQSWLARPTRLGRAGLLMPPPQPSPPARGCRGWRAPAQLTVGLLQQRSAGGDREWP